MLGCRGYGARFRHNPELFVENVESSVESSLENVYNNEQGSTIRFTKHSPAHDHLRTELFAQLETKAVRSPAVTRCSIPLVNLTSDRQCAGREA